jgi:fucose permease
MQNPALMATKTSILIFYLTLSKTHKVFRWATIATLAVVNIGGLALTLLNIFQCSPVFAAFLTPVPDSANCTNIVTIYLSSAPLNIITDLAIFFLPMPILTSMRLPFKQKMVLVVTFGFGIFVAAIDVIRIYYLQDAQRENLRAVRNRVEGEDARNTSDFSWYASLSFMWSAVEINTGIMCACVPALKPLVRRFLPQWVLDQTVHDKSASKTSDSMVIPPDIVSERTRSTISPPTSPLTAPPHVAFEGPPPASTDPDAEMGIVDFLTTPDMNDMPYIARNETHATYATTARTRRNSTAFFDFVDMERRKNITLRSNRESVFPIIMVTVLFFVWGFAYGLLDTLNARFQAVAHMSNGQTVGQHSAYYLGYLIGPLTFGRLVFRTWGFKACYMVGLTIYACGTLIFWPSAVLTSFPAFLISNFIVGLGLSTLELGANPFIALCGPPEYAEARLNLSQGIQATGTVVSPLLARKVLFRAGAENLIDVQWAYLGIAFFTILLAIVYYYIPLPEATDDELETASARMPIPRHATFTLGQRTSNVKIVWITLGLGVFSQFCYVGGQESVSTGFPGYVRRVMPSLDVVSHQAIGHTAFAISRFLAALLNIWITPRYLLLFFFAGAVAFSAAAMVGTGVTPAVMIVMVMFFEGPLFPLIYAQSIRGLGRHTKDASVLLTSAIGGGAVVTPIAFVAAQLHNVQYAYCVVVAFYAAGMLFPIWLNTHPAARKLSSPVRDEQTRRESQAEDERRESMGNASEKRRTWDKIKNRWSWSRGKGDGSEVEHRERKSWPEGHAPAGHYAPQLRHDSSQTEGEHVARSLRAHGALEEDFVDSTSSSSSSSRSTHSR